MHKALEQDSTVYDYDAVYDDIQNQRLESNKKILRGADKRVIMLVSNTCIVTFVNVGISEWSNGQKDCPLGPLLASRHCACAVVRLFHWCWALELPHEY